MDMGSTDDDNNNHNDYGYNHSNDAAPTTPAIPTPDPTPKQNCTAEWPPSAKLLPVMMRVRGHGGVGVQGTKGRKTEQDDVVV